jgi:conjugative transposon TraN protein
MIRLSILITPILFCCAFQVKAQEAKLADHARFIAPYALEICSSETTHIVFRAPISSVDRGNSDVLIQKAPSAENILQVKAGKEEFTPTNLTVLTGDGRLYAFNLSYNPRPLQTNIVMSKDTIHTGNLSNVNRLPEPMAIFSKANYNEGDVDKAIATITADAKSNCKVRDKNHKVTLTLNSIYVQDDLIFLKVKIDNKSFIDYETAGLRLMIRDLKRSKRTATQELEIQPVRIEGNPTLVKGVSSEELTIAVPRFTIPDKKKFIIQLMEHNGGRHLQLKVSNRILVKAKPVSF